MARASGFRQLILTGLIVTNYISITCINDVFFCKQAKYEETFTLYSVLKDHMMTSCVILMQNDFSKKGIRIF